jgi:hypothetical protein
MITITITHFKDERGRALVRVPIARSDRFCTLEEQDFSALLELGTPVHWVWKQDCIWVRSGGKSIAIGRILLDCSPGQCLRYINHDPTDLRRDNLVLTNGMSKYRARDMLTRSFPRTRLKLRHVDEENQGT